MPSYIWHQIKILPIPGKICDAIFPYGALIYEHGLTWGQDGFVAISVKVPTAMGGDTQGVKRWFYFATYRRVVEEEYYDFIGIARFIGPYVMPEVDELKRRVEELRNSIERVGKKTHNGNFYLETKAILPTPSAPIQTVAFGELFVYEAKPIVTFLNRPPLPLRGLQ